MTVDQPFEPPPLGTPDDDGALHRIARRERLDRWSTACLVGSWLLACVAVVVGAVTTRWPFILVMVLVTALAVGSVALAALALRASPRRSWSRLLVVGVLNLVLLPNVAFVIGLIANVAIHGFDLPT